MMAKRSVVASNGTGWHAASLHALRVVTVMLALFTYWFAVADRYTVFLYDHGMGPLVPDTSPFSRVTSSRYWMAGLVASGVALALYGAVWLALAGLVAGLTRLRQALETRRF